MLVKSGMGHSGANKGQRGLFAGFDDALLILMPYHQTALIHLKPAGQAIIHDPPEQIIVWLRFRGDLDIETAIVPD